MATWLRFFFGTPRRFLVTLAISTIIFGLFRPELVANAISDLLAALLQAVGPFVQPILVLAIVIVGIRIMIFGWKKK